MCDQFFTAPGNIVSYFNINSFNRNVHSTKLLIPLLRYDLLPLINKLHTRPNSHTNKFSRLSDMLKSKIAL